MKNLLTLAIILTSATAFATRSRMNSLGNSPHLSDVNTVYGNPADMSGYKDSLTLETGVSGGATYTANTGTTAEGLMIRSMGDAKFGFALGHKNALVNGYRGMFDSDVAAGQQNPISQQNPFSIMYSAKAGDMAWGVGFDYSNFSNKTAGAEEKESSMGLNLGARTSAWDAAINLSLGNTWEKGTGATKDDFKGTTGFSISGGYNMSSDMYLYANITSGGFKSTIDTVDNVNYEQMDYKVGVVSTVKQDANEFFYGVALASTSLKQKTAPAGTKTTTMSLPLIIGLEADAASWLTLRGSITQTVLINDNKTAPDTGTATTDLSPGANNTTFAAGAGLKLNAVTLDGNILASGSQNLNAGAGNLLGQVGLTYNF